MPSVSFCLITIFFQKATKFIGGKGTGGYPSHGSGYPPQVGGYPPQGGGYPPQGGGYPPQGGGYPPQGGGYPPYGGGYPPSGGAGGGHVRGNNMMKTAAVLAPAAIALGVSAVSLV